MFLSRPQKRRADHLFEVFKRKPNEYFSESGIEKCIDCDGTGLSYSGRQGDFMWDCNSYCDTCYGVGFIGLGDTVQIDDVTFLCRKCNGVGCGECNQGFTDWISHIMGR